MTTVFLKLLNMSIAASWLVLAVILLRALLKKSPRWITCLLWGIVALRLLMPFTFESNLSLIPSQEVIPMNVAVTETPAIHSGIPAVNSAVNPLFTTDTFPTILDEVLHYAAIAWLAGAALLLIYSGISYIRLYLQIRASLRLRDNLYICDSVESPFLLGIFRPRIYLPSGVEEAQLDYIIAHENAHIKRRDHWWKPFGYLLLTVYWFNPLLWVAYILLCRDIERACDEKVIARMDPAGKVGYSEALAACSVHRRMVMTCPVAFGEISVKSRIKGVLNYKKPAVRIVCISLALCILTAVCFLTNPVPCTHNYSGQTTVASTCTEEGIRTLTCDHCRHSYTVHAAVLDHTYDQGTVTQEPTCIEQGTKVYTCTGCGKQITGDLEITPHTLGTPFVTHEPNCAETGEECATCTYCQETFVTQVIPTNDVHDLTETVLREATCAKEGKGEITCSRCDYAESCSYEKLEHNYVKKSDHWVTCEWYGIRTMKCTECGKTYDIELKPRGHDWEWHNGQIECERCGMRGSGIFPYGEPEDLSDPRVIQLVPENP